MSKRKHAARAARARSRRTIRPVEPGDVVADIRGFAGVVSRVDGERVTFVMASTTLLDPLPGHELIRRRPAGDLTVIGHVDGRHM